MPSGDRCCLRGVIVLMEFGPLKGNFLLSLYLSFFPAIGPSLYIVLHLMIWFWTESAEPPHASTAVSTPAKTARCLRTSLDSPLELILCSQYIFMMFVKCSTVAHGLVLAKTRYLRLFLSVPSSSFFLHIHYFLPRLPTRTPLLVPSCSQRPTLKQRLWQNFRKPFRKMVV